MSDLLDDNAVKAVAELARSGGEPTQLELGMYYAVNLGDRVHEIDLTGNAFRDRPERKAGNTTVRDVPSFLAYAGKHGDEDSEIYADRQQLTVTALLDAHGDEPNWCQHRVTLRLKHSDEFEAWKSASGRMMPQTTFAEFIEEHRAAVTEPPGAEMLELVQSFHATTKVTFKSGTVLHSGQRQLQYVEETNASAGAKGNLTIPQTFNLALAVFEGADVADAVTARLKYRIDDGRLTLGFHLDRLNDVVSGAFKAVVDEIGGGVVQPILYGTPA